MLIARKKVGDLFDMKLGKMLSGKNFTGKHLKPYLRNVNVQWGRIDLSSVNEMDFDDKDFERYKLEKGDILVCEGGEVGRTAIYNGEIENCCYQNALHRLRVKNCSVDPKYFLHYMNFAASHGLIQKQTSAVTIAHFTAEKFKEFEIPLPDLKTQQEIAGILEQADVARQTRKQANQLTEQFLQSAFLEMFGDPVRNEKGWEVKPLEYFGKWRSGGTPLRSNKIYFDGEIPWYTSGELNQMYIAESIEHISKTAVEESSAKLIEPSTLLLGMYDTAALKSSITTIPCSCNQAIAYSKLENGKVNITYLYFSIQIGREYFRSQQRGVRQKNMNLNMIKNLSIPLPPPHLQKKFAILVEQVERLRVKQRESEKELENLFGSLMQKYFG
jgi:type I restriction enzyme S subunit